MFCAPELVFHGTEGVGSCIHVLRARTRVGLYRGRRVRFSCFARPDSCWAVPSASGPVFMFCALGLVFGGTDGVGPRFHVLRSRTRFRRWREHRVPFSCFALPNSFSAVPSASGPIFMFCAPGLIFGGAHSLGSRFHVFRSRTRFRRCRVRRVPFSCFARPDSFLAVPMASRPVFMFCAPGLVFGGADGLGSRFHVLRSRTHFRRSPGRRVPFSCFARPDSFSAVPRASGPVFMFCAPGLVFGGTDGVRFRFHILRARNHFRRYRGRGVLISCFARPDSFSAVPSVWGPVFMFWAPELVFGGA
jgi:hypothetical protein